MIALLFFFQVLLPMVYLVVWGSYMWLFLADHPTARRWCTRLAFIAVFLHLGAIGVQSLVLGRLPMGAPLEFASLLAVAMLVTYLVIEQRLKAKGTGFVVTGMAFLMEFIAAAFRTSAPAASPLLKDPGFAGHAILVLLSYTALSLSFLYSILYLIQSRQLARRQFGLFFRRLPSLETLERMSVGAVKLGVPLMLASLCLGHLWMYDLAERMPPDIAAKLSPYDPKVLVAWVIFLGYSLGLIGNRFFGWRGRKMSVMAIATFVTILLALGVVQHFFPTFHKFYSTQSMTTVVAAGAPLLSFPRQVRS
ncbi:MAG: cytochrome c biogenesis protein CcsA [Gemmatimonadales bacterium]|nr:cytochrome c biogenesis protein CcsA [Gemmatimonadales bacterium]